VLPGFLDLISSKLSDTTSRKLTVQINEHTTTSVWRLKVLNSLRSLLSAIVKNTSLGSESNYAYLYIFNRYIKTAIPNYFVTVYKFARYAM